jgi:hypothetical protein
VESTFEGEEKGERPNRASNVPSFTTNIRVSDTTFGDASLIRDYEIFRGISMLSGTVEKDAETSHHLGSPNAELYQSAGVTLSATADASGNPLSRIKWTGLIQNGLDFLVGDGYMDGSNRRTKRAYKALEDPNIDGLLDAADTLSSQLRRQGQFPSWLQSVFGSLYQDIRHSAILRGVEKIT